MAIRAAHLELENQQRIGDADALRLRVSQEQCLPPLLLFRSDKFEWSNLRLVRMRSARRRYNPTLPHPAAPKAFAVLINRFCMTPTPYDSAPSLGTKAEYEHLSVLAIPELMLGPRHPPPTPTPMRPPASSLKPQNLRLLGSPIARQGPVSSGLGVHASHPRSLQSLTSAAPNKPLVPVANGSARNNDEPAVITDDHRFALRPSRRVNWEAPPSLSMNCDAPSVYKCAQAQAERRMSVLYDLERKMTPVPFICAPEPDNEATLVGEKRKR
ncbi:hypothetical protein K438DRAFT_2025942 [Mycena galopus ATCC 62051]|nr:hypothetical protein K438DRAFT_2025942 [Mycena galopus ATCC 62051]